MEIHRRFEGELTVRKPLVIHATGKVTGKVRYGKLSIEEGGAFSGDVGALATTDVAARKDRPVASAKPPADCSDRGCPGGVRVRPARC